MELNIRTRSSATGRTRARRRNIVLIGNFSGRSPSEFPHGAEAVSCDMHAFDPHDLDPVINRLRPRTGLDLADQRWELQISNIDDFHPDKIYELAIFAAIRELKQALADPARSRAAATAVRKLLGIPRRDVESEHERQRPDVPAPSRETSTDMFARLLGGTASQSSLVNESVQRLLKEATGGELANETDAESTLLRNQLDGWTQTRMRELLLAPGFRELESNWRSLQWLGERIDATEHLGMWLVDVGTLERSAWVSSLRAEIQRKLAGEKADLLVVLDEISTSAGSLQHLSTLMQVAIDLECPLLSAARPELAGIDAKLADLSVLDASDVGEVHCAQWAALRAEAGANRVGLGFPRFLLRQPYGKRSDPIECMPFEELTPRPDHEAFLWGNPAIAITAIWLAEAEVRRQPLEIADLPTVVYDDGSGQAIKPPTEVYLTDTAADALLSAGVMPLLGRRGHTEIRLPRIQSIAIAATNLLS